MTTLTKCPQCNSDEIVKFKEYIFCKQCKRKFSKEEFGARGPDRMVCPVCGSEKTIDLRTHLYCRECETRYDKKEYYPYYSRSYYFCPRCGNKDVYEEKDRVYCDRCELFFLKSSIRTMEEGQDQEVWSVREGLKMLEILDPEKKGYKIFKDDLENHDLE